MIASPNFPGPSDANISCTFSLLHGASFSSRRIAFRVFSLTESINCTDSYVKIYNGKINDNTLLATKCGNVTGDMFTKAQDLIFVLNSGLNKGGGIFQIEATGTFLIKLMNMNILLLVRPSYYLIGTVLDGT